MKKIWVIVIINILLISIVSCNGGKVKNKEITLEDVLAESEVFMQGERGYGIRKYDKTALTFVESTKPDPALPKTVEYEGKEYEVIQYTQSMVNGIEYEFYFKTRTALVWGGDAEYLKKHNFELTIPSRVKFEEKNYTVTEIGAGAFGSWYDAIYDDDSYYEEESKKPHMCDIQKIELPNTIERIGKEAFRFSSLTEITIPSSVKVIEADAFLNTEIKSVIIPEGVVGMGELAFDVCKIEQIAIPSTLKYIGEGFDFSVSAHLYYKVKKITLSPENPYFEIKYEGELAGLVIKDGSGGDFSPVQ